MKTITVPEDQFVSVYQPLVNHLDTSASFDWGDGRGTLFETFGDELTFVRSQAREKIWTLLTVDDVFTIVSGFHFVNRLGYFICKISIEPGLTVEVPLKRK